MSDLADTIRAAMNGEAPEANPEPVASAPEPVQAAVEVDALSGTPVLDTKTPDTGKSADEGAPNRAPDGKFAPKDTAATPADAAAAPPTTPETATPEVKGPDDQATPIPPSLSAAIKAKWSDLDPEVRKEFARIEGSVQTAKAEWDKKASRLNRYEEIIAPHRDAWAVQGLDDQQALTRLVAAEQVLRTNAPQGIVYLAQAYGVDLRQLVQPTGQPGPGAPQGYTPQQAAPASGLDPNLHPLLAEIQTLKSQVEQMSQGATQATQATVQAQIAEFAGKPENRYFENVREDVARLLETGAATTLQDAYDKAIWASPEIRPHLLQAETAKAAQAAQAQAQAAQAEAAARAKAQNAQHASGSVTGAPSPGASAPRPGSTGNLRADLEAAYQQATAAV